MTLAEFKYLAADETYGLITFGGYVEDLYWSTGYVSPNIDTYGSEIIILFNTYPGNIIKVDAIGVKIADFPLEVLEQVIAIDVHIPGVGPIINVPTIDSDVPYRRIEKTVNGPYFIYAISPEEQRPIIIGPTTGSAGYEEYTSTAVLEYPALSLIRRAGDYDLELPINRARESAHIYKCDRVNPTANSKTNPINLANILNNAAPYASVQDSNYTSTPWINGRYEGTKIDSATNKGTDPFLQGAFFQGAFFTKDVTSAYIENLVNTSTITYVDYFAVGNLSTPAYAVESLNLKLSLPFSTTSSIMNTVTTFLPSSNQNINLGDLLQISTNDSATFSDEVLAVSKPTPPGIYSPYEFLTRSTISGETSKINTIRSYSNTYRNEYQSGSTLYRIIPIQLLQIDKAKITPVQEGIIKIKGVEGTIYTSTEGYIISGSSRIVL